jgi:hypothetical protein
MRVSYETCSNFIGRFEAGDATLLDSSSSSSLEEALEFKLTKVLNEVRSKASAILTEGLHWNNTALNMYELLTLSLAPYFCVDVVRSTGTAARAKVAKKTSHK